MNIASLFSGCGGLDLGFQESGFNISWANEYDSTIWETYELNHPETFLDKRSITEIPSNEIPDCIGIIGGPPCQSWSEAGAGRGIKDARGQLFYEYIRTLKDKQPLFFLAENVSGILTSRHFEEFKKILAEFKSAKYNVEYKLLNAADYCVPQTRQRVIIVGYHESMGKHFEYPLPHKTRPTMQDAIGNMPEPLPALDKNYANSTGELSIANHEYMHGGFSTMYMSRNRVRGWDEQSFTIQAGGRHAPCHPQANKMIFVEQDKRIFDPKTTKPYRRLSVRECARVQTFPDDFVFKYSKVADGYKMIGNAVPVNFAKALAEVIYRDVSNYMSENKVITNHLWENSQESAIKNVREPVLA